MQTLRIGTLNIWNRSGPWPDRLVAIRAGLRTLAPDVMGLQEVLRPTTGEAPDQARLIAEGFGYHIAYGAAWEAGGVEFGNAVLSRYPVRKQESIRLPAAGSTDQRCLLHAELETELGPLQVYVTHLNWRYEEGHVREAQVQYIAEAVRSLSAVKGLPAILVGDFNADPDSDEIRFLRGHKSLGGQSICFTDCFAVAGGEANGSTFSRNNPFAADLRLPERRVDYVFVRPLSDERGPGEPLEARVCFNEPVGGVYPSDHFGVAATIRMS